MSDARGHDHLPDPAALDELMRAFAVEETDAVDIADADAADDAGEVSSSATEASGAVDVEPARRDESDESDESDEFDLIAADDLDHDDDQGAHDDLPIAEQEPPTTDEPAPPTTIRIDDLAGSRVIVEPDPALRATPSPDDRPADPRSDASGPVVIPIDADEELPDAVYVEGSLDRNGSGTIVIIEDDDTGDALAPETERNVRRGIEPRLRERRVAVKRAQSLKRLKWVALVGAIVVVVVGALALLGSPLFAVRADRVTITGNVYADPVAVQAVVDDIVGTPALRVDTQRAERDLEAIPWVDEARVDVDFPHAASIEIREREAWTTYQGPDLRYRVLDRDGRVLDVLEGYPIAYVLIIGPDPVDLDPGEFAPRGYAAASELAKRLTGSVRTQVESIEVVADGSQLSLRLDDGTEVRFGEARDLFAKLVRLETVLSAGDERPPGIIDVSTREVTVPGDGSGQDEDGSG